jgi:uncharacterized protein YceK
MKTTKLLTGSIAVATVLLLSGCQSTASKQSASASDRTATTASMDTTTSGATTPAKATSRSAAYDTSALVAAFRTSDIPSNQMVSATVNAINSRNYSTAINELQRLIRYPGLTAPQATAVQELLGRLSS